VTSASGPANGVGASDASAAPGVPRVSLVIPVYNAEATIERCLESVIAQRVDFEYEVIVADSSSDRTPEIIARRFPSVRLVRLERRAFPGTARNAAIRESRAPLVAMIDADCIADPDLLARMVALHESGDYGAVGGSVVNGTPGSPSGLVGYILEFREFIPKAPAREVITIPTANICYRREIFDRYGYFDDVRASEDLLFNWRISLAGERILFDPSIRVTHLNKTGWRRVIGYQNVLGRSSALARLRMNPPFEVIRAYPALGWLMPYLIRHPSLGLLIPIVRLGRAVLWLLKYDLKLFAWLLVLWPGYLLGAFLWSTSFVSALRAMSAGRLAASDRGETVGAVRRP
jgi:glycosyltransferase involved in cell wall biosynthesis